MEIATAFTTLTAAVGSARKVFEASRTLANAELKQMIADLSSQMADLSLHMADLKHEIIRLQEENATLKGKAEGAKPTLKWGCYVFEGDETLYCPRCYETQGKKHPTSRIMHNVRKCSICDALLGT